MRDARGGKVPGIVGVVSLRRPVRDDIRGIGRDGDRGCEVCLLPARGRFVGERDGGEQSAGASPEVPIVCTEVLGALVEPYSGNVAGNIRQECQAQLLGNGRRHTGRFGNRRGRPNRNRGRADDGRGIKDHIDPIVGRGGAGGRKGASSIDVHPVGSVRSTGQCLDWQIAHGRGEGAVISGVVSLRGMV